MSIRCNGCGKFIPYKALLEGWAKTEFTPLNEFGPEVIEHICHVCIMNFEDRGFTIWGK